VKRIGVLALLLSLAVAGCASSGDGGPVGSGISASMVSGNIVAVASPTPSTGQGQNAGAMLEPVVVSIDEAPTVVGNTDANGNFLLSGAFSGQVTVRFSTAEFSAAQPLNVPAGSVVILQDVVIRPGAVRIASLWQLNFFGTVAFTECQSNVVEVNDRKSNKFEVGLSPHTSITNAGGEPVACSAIQEGQSVSVQGAGVLRTGSIAALAVEVGPPTPGNPQAIQQIRVFGTIHTSGVNCDTGNILLDVPGGGTFRVRLSPSTVIKGRADQQPLTCQDLSDGDTLDGQGLIDIHDPSVVNAQTLTVG
jgi:hypothetical protein